MPGVTFSQAECSSSGESCQTIDSAGSFPAAASLTDLRRPSDVRRSLELLVELQRVTAGRCTPQFSPWLQRARQWRARTKVAADRVEVARGVSARRQSNMWLGVESFRTRSKWFSRKAPLAAIHGVDGNAPTVSNCRRRCQ